ncbi:PDR/VanB family oxidoreductase [Variovorax boronicumulans]|uniref:PDR/VanB family oxidoreductase n=1 Tax=Variovorax boronicumulans TaxID=436515 RepID=UPI001C5647BD
MGTLLKVRVARREMLAEGIAGYELAAVDGAALPDFMAGAHIDVHLPGGLVRQYSLCELPGTQGRYRIGVLRDPQSRGGSARLIDAVREGDELAIGAPRNHFALQGGTQRSLLFAGGIGVTPILCMAQQLAREGRPFEMHYCGRSLSRMAFVDTLRGSGYSDQVRIHVDEGPPAQRFDARTAIGAAAEDSHLYVCGPTGFMDHVLETARSLGWPEERLHREYFAAAPVDHAGDDAFELELLGTGQVVPVRAEQSAAQALLDAGFPLSLSCEQGVCGTCITRVAQGVPDHRDLYLTEEEHLRNDAFMPCCSRARTPRLVIDLQPVNPSCN